METFKVIICELCDMSEEILFSSDIFYDTFHYYNTTDILDKDNFLEYYIEFRRYLNGQYVPWDIDDSRISQLRSVHYIVK